MIRRKQLAIALSKLQGFQKPKIYLEQYMSDSEEISKILWEAMSYEDVVDKVILDPGAGTGVIGIGALILGAKKVIFIEKDQDAIDILKENLKQVEDLFEGEYEIIKHNFLTLDELKVDTIIQNPPFGTRDEHADINFLKKGFEIANNIYTIHKTSTIHYIKDLIFKEGFNLFYEYNFHYPLKNTYEHQIKKVKKIETTSLGFTKEAIE